MVEVDRRDLAKPLSEGFPQATAEKVWRLLGVLRELQASPATRDRLTLKGGTALNVFHSPTIPRLSVDIDLMATGFPDAAPNTADRGRLIESVKAALSRLNYRVSEASADAGWTLFCGYRNSLGSVDRIKLDLDLLNRMTLLDPVDREGPVLFDADDLRFPVADPAELLGQKLTAVAYRAAERDLYDMWTMLRAGWHERPRARPMYLAYSFLSDPDWYRLGYPARLDVPYEHHLLEDVLRGSEPAPTLGEIRELARGSLAGAAPPFTVATPREQSLRRDLLRGELAAFGEIAGEKIEARRRTLARHPGLAWRLQQARRAAPQRRRSP